MSYPTELKKIKDELHNLVDNVVIAIGNRDFNATEKDKSTAAEITKLEEALGKVHQMNNTLNLPKPDEDDEGDKKLASKTHSKAPPAAEDDHDGMDDTKKSTKAHK